MNLNHIFKKNDLILEAFCKLDQFQSYDKTVYNSQPNKFIFFYKIDYHSQYLNLKEI